MNYLVFGQERPVRGLPGYRFQWPFTCDGQERVRADLILEQRHGRVQCCSLPGRWSCSGRPAPPRFKKKKISDFKISSEYIIELKQLLSFSWYTITQSYCMLCMRLRFQPFFCFLFRPKIKYMRPLPILATFPPPFFLSHFALPLTPKRCKFHHVPKICTRQVDTEENRQRQKIEF